MGICSTCPSPLNFTIRFLLPTVVITTSCILGLCIVSDRPVFCGCSLPSTGTGRGGPRSTRPGSAFDAPTCRAGSVGRLCAARMISCLPRRPGSTRGTLLCPAMCRRVNRSWFQASWSPATTQRPRVFLSWRYPKRAGSRLASEKCWIPRCLPAWLHIRSALYLC